MKYIMIIFNKTNIFYDFVFFFILHLSLFKMYNKIYNVFSKRRSLQGTKKQLFKQVTLSHIGRSYRFMCVFFYQYTRISLYSSSFSNPALMAVFIDGIFIFKEFQ